MRSGLIDWDSSRCDIRECITHMQEMRNFCASRLVRAGMIAIAFLAAGLVALFFNMNIPGIVLLLIAVYFWQESGRHELLGNVITALWPIALLINSTRAKEQDQNSSV